MKFLYYLIIMNVLHKGGSCCHCEYCLAVLVVDLFGVQDACAPLVPPSPRGGDDHPSP